ncbi:MAG: hypothetical protein GY765_35375 [bacterium]|nr:hypothetical protein [bacterium]
MKHQKAKKLTLNKVTIAGLNANAMFNLHGGAFNDETGTSAGSDNGNDDRTRRDEVTNTGCSCIRACQRTNVTCHSAIPGDCRE